MSYVVLSVSRWVYTLSIKIELIKQTLLFFSNLSTPINEEETNKTNKRRTRKMKALLNCHLDYCKVVNLLGQVHTTHTMYIHVSGL